MQHWGPGEWSSVGGIVLLAMLAGLAVVSQAGGRAQGAHEAACIANAFDVHQDVVRAAVVNQIVEDFTEIVLSNMESINVLTPWLLGWTWTQALYKALVLLP